MFEAEGRMVIAFRPVDKYPKFQIKFDGVWFYERKQVKY